MTRLVIVDLDGTLVDSFAEIERGMERALADVGVEVTPATRALCRRGVPLESYYQSALGCDPGAPGQRARFSRFVAAYRRHYGADRNVPTVYPGVAATLAELTRTRPRVRLAVGTSKHTDMARAIVHRAGLSRFFHLVLGSEQGPKKPDPALLLRIARALDVRISHAVMVGDTGADVGAARAAGCPAIAVTYGGWPRTELAAMRPAHLIDRFSELLALV